MKHRGILGWLADFFDLADPLVGSPLWATIQDILHLWSRVDFWTVYDPVEWSLNSIGRLLKRRGIKAWSLMVIDEEWVLFSVRKSDAARTRQILGYNGIVITSP